MQIHMASYAAPLHHSNLTGTSVQFGRAIRQKEAVAEEELAIVRKLEKRAEAVKYAHAPIPTFDYVAGRFSPRLAQDFADKVFKIKGEALFSGKDLLTLLMSPKAVQPNQPPIVDRLSSFELNRLGKSESFLREHANSHQFAFSQLYEAVREAMRYGLVYQIKDIPRGLTLYGVPNEVRSTLQLKVPEEAQAAVSDAQGVPAAKPVTPYGKTIEKLLEKAKTLSPKSEFFEFTAQLAQAALEAELIAPESIPAEFKPAMTSIGVTEKLSSATLTILEAASGGELEALAKELCLNGISQGVVGEQEYEETKALLHLAI